MLGLLAETSLKLLLKSSSLITSVVASLIQSKYFSSPGFSNIHLYLLLFHSAIAYPDPPFSACVNAFLLFY